MPEPQIRVCVAFGTRPEAIKMAPVVAALAADDRFDHTLLLTGQHRKQLDDVLEVFGMRADRDLDVMADRQRVADVIGRVVPAASDALSDLAPDFVLVHGDTATTFAVALAAFLLRIPVGHVEAGLRTHTLAEPFPEEANRRLTDVLTDLDFPPTSTAKANLVAEGKPEERIVVTGNTEVDAALSIVETVTRPEHLPDGPLVAITMHRRESFGVMADLAAELAAIARNHPEYTFVYPVHLNPVVRDAVWKPMSGVANIVLDEPYDYPAMVGLVSNSELIITDSGGLQELGATLAVPVVVLRDRTERPEGITAGVTRLAGTDPARIRSVIEPLLASADARAAMRSVNNPFGDGRAAGRIVEALAWRFERGERPADWTGA